MVEGDLEDEFMAEFDAPDGSDLSASWRDCKKDPMSYPPCFASASSTLCASLSRSSLRGLRGFEYGL